ncbi:MAG: lamin tail domain-containing protein [Trueperella sp.]|nr:lamin tail domain-containing protein [Trueperella sp.]
MRRMVSVAAAGILAFAAFATSAVAAPAEIAPTDARAIIITEIAPDNTSYDNFEYFEVTNASSQPIDLAAAGYSFAYSYVDSADTTKDVPLSLVAGETAPVLAPGESAVMWLNYVTKTVDSYAKTVADFRAATKMTSTAPIVRVEGQAGMANGGERGVRVLRAGEVQNWSFYPAGTVSPDKSIDFGLPETGSSMRVVQSLADYTPGVINPVQLEIADPTPAPDPDPDPTPEQPAPTTSAALVITEAVVDSSNVGSSDGYEFIEIANATAEPVDFTDFKIRYLYPIDEQSNSNSVVWESVPDQVVIPAGETLVFWIKNGPNDDLTAQDFNKFYGTDLAAGTELVEIYQGGMANGSKRGLQIETNTGVMINRAYYNMTERDVQKNKGLTWLVNEEDLLKQTLAGSNEPTPGALEANQLPNPLLSVTADTVAPVITDHTADSIDPAAAFPISFTVTDDVQVRTATLTVTSSAPGDARTVNLLAVADQYSYEIPVADLTGKRWIEYSLAVTDGFNKVSTQTRRIAVAGINADPVRLNYEDGDWVSGVTDVIAATDSLDNPATLSIDGVKVATEQSLEAFPTFAMEVTQTDIFFRNGILAGGDILKVFDDGTYERIETISTPVPTSYIEGNKLTVSVYAGTKAAPEIDVNENNDDFQIRALRLILPDGRSLTPEGLANSNTWLRMGDSAGKLDYVDAVFTLPADAFTAQSYQWDTTKVADGEHTLHAVAGGDTDSATVNVDNTKPVITVTGVKDGELAQGDFTIAASATDGGIGLDHLSAQLDGKIIELPYQTSSLDLEAGKHELVVRASDQLGNEAVQVISFTTPVETPAADGYAPANGATLPAGDVQLSAKVTDTTADRVDVTFYQGIVADLKSEVRIGVGTTNDAAASERESVRELTAQEIDALAKVDGVVEQTTAAAFPYRLFEVDVTDVNSQMRVRWDGQAEANSQVALYGKRADGSGWQQLDRHITTPESTSFALEGLIDTADYAVNGSATFLVQHSDGWAGADLSTRQSAVTRAHIADKPRNEYDFTIAWESDTQYYNEEFYQHQVAIHDYILAQRKNMNIQYVFHTGDIVDEADKLYQWENADPQYARFDQAQLPYGVLAGNHDVSHRPANYTNYYQYFGEQRFENNPWYGGSYANNRGHYDLISAGGIDFVIVSMGWEIGDEQIDWMNDVLAAHPDRVGIISLHEFLLTTGGLGPIPQRILDEVAAKNSNVRMILSGHYHDAYTRTDSFDDDGDGVAERTVTSMLFDYQGLPEGGQGFLRLLHFDNVGRQMHVRTFSPSLNRYNSEDPSLTYLDGNRYRDQDFRVSYDQLGIEPGQYTLATDAFRAEVLTQKVIGEASNLSTPTTAQAVWADLAAGTYHWYVRVLDEHGAEFLSPVLTFTVAATTEEPSPDNGGEADPVQPVDPNPDEPTVPDPGETTQPGDATQPGESGQSGQPSLDAPSGPAPDGESLAATGLASPGLLAVALLFIGAGTLAIVRYRRPAAGC